MLLSSSQPQRPDRPAASSTYDVSLRRADESFVRLSPCTTQSSPPLAASTGCALPLTVLSSRASIDMQVETPFVRCALCCRRRHRQMKQALFEVPGLADNRPYDRGASLVFNGDHLATPAPVSRLLCGNDTGSRRTCFEKVSFRSRRAH